MIIYEPLFRTLQKKSMKRTDLLQYISSSTLAKLGNNQPVNIQILDRLCEVLDCELEDIAKYKEKAVNTCPNTSTSQNS